MGDSVTIWEYLEQASRVHTDQRESIAWAMFEHRMDRLAA